MEREWCEYLNVRHAKLESKDSSSDSDIPAKIYKVNSQLPAGSLDRQL